MSATHYFTPQQYTFPAKIKRDARMLDIDDDFVTVKINDVFTTENFYKNNPKTLSAYLESIIMDNGYKSVKATILKKHIRFVAFKTVDGNTL